MATLRRFIGCAGIRLEKNESRALGPRIRAEYSYQMLQRNRWMEPFRFDIVIVVNAAKG
jgi:hypothetical protein